MELELLRAIIVDDEINARKIVPIIIDWQAVGYRFVGEASNGSEALDLIETMKPDVVFTDISMPFMDGLELSRLIKERYPLVKIVIITAHPEFEYAKRSLDIGVQNFILKPLQAEEVRRVAVDLHGEIREETERWNEYQELNRQLKENAVQLKEKFLNDLLSGLWDPDQLDSRFHYFFPDSANSLFSIMLIELQISLEEGEEQRILQSLRCKRFIDYALEEYEGIEVFFDNSQRIVLLNRKDNQNLTKIGEWLAQSLHEKLECKASIGVGSTCKDFNRIKESYKEALEAVRYGKLKGSNAIYFFNDEIHFGGRSWEVKTNEIEEILFFVKAGVLDKAMQSIEKLFQDLEKSKAFSVERARLVSAQFVSTLINSLAEMGVILDNNLSFDISPYKRIFELDSLPDMQQTLLELTEKVTFQVTRARSKKTNNIIHEVKEFIQQEMHIPEMSLSYVSNKFHMNSSYFSRIFKQDIGISFTDYLLKCRMEKAVKLLNETDWKAYQIAEKVGIKDPFYFSNCFKKVMGVSVQEYKKNSFSL
ncbi:hypothetical protein BSK66_07270 [Paenibacillus odorifer]|uniref:DNA-binding response regulator n=1 Tax=Paenibacillus odorifer TaxID=189426 RepID=A0A1R0WUZ0_9BACL|nr:MULTISPECIES: response regulator [Paenibacillus]ETT65928.1 AraC family transcriptional regulator [Paenibacillus sp. FSL H8-237]OMD21530.1 hypothetical protein BJP51_07870 [Paenibacillus odorifer]OME62157.1 hypothetical protein BSK66_07270 [Paenibacillus odorifer]